MLGWRRFLVMDASRGLPSLSTLKTASASIICDKPGKVINFGGNST